MSEQHGESYAPEAPSEVADVLRLSECSELEELGSPRLCGSLSSLPICICVARNEIERLPCFLRHHRELGIEQFIFIDHASTDGTTDYLLQQPDVMLYGTSQDFDWRRKHGWIMSLVRRYGPHQWFLLLDADEHCVFDGSDRTTIAVLIDELERQSRRCARGALVDMYAQGPIAGNVRPTTKPLVEHFCFFDAYSYSEHRNAAMTLRTGGPRQRVFAGYDPAFRPQLTKYPLFKLLPDEVAYSPHAIWPPHTHADDPCYIGLLHYKFDSKLFERLTDAVERRQYWNGSLEYNAYFTALQDQEGLSFHFAGSRRYSAPQDLVAAEIISSMPSANNGIPRIGLTIELERAIAAGRAARLQNWGDGR